MFSKKIKEKGVVPNLFNWLELLARLLTVASIFALAYGLLVGLTNLGAEVGAVRFIQAGDNSTIVIENATGSWIHTSNGTITVANAEGSQIDTYGRHETIQI